MAANAGASLDLVRKIVGHTSRAMTWHYFHTDEGALRDTVSQLPDVTGGAVAVAVSDSPVVIDAETIEECQAAAPSSALSRVCDEVRRLSAEDRAAVVRVAVEGLKLAEITALENEIQKEVLKARSASKGGVR